MTNILPDPNNAIDNTGAWNPSGTPGPGYKSVRLNSNQPIMKSRTHSGRVVTRAVAAPYWSISISYNPMTKDEFDVIYSFLLSRRGGLVPFLVSLPQYVAPKDAAMTINPTVTNLTAPGLNTVDYTSTTGVASRGDLFTITDPLDSTHTKAYVVTAVDAGIISISPPVSKEVSAGSTLVFINPMLRVVMTEPAQEYDLGVNNLYNISLSLEEVQA